MGKKAYLVVLGIGILLFMVLLAFGFSAQTTNKDSSETAFPEFLLECDTLRQFTWQLDIKQKKLEPIFEDKLLHGPCFPEPKTKASTVKLELRDKNDELIYSTYLAVSFNHYYDYVVNGKLTGGIVPAEKLMIKTYIPWVEKTKDSKLRLIRLSDNSVLAETRL